MPYADLQTIPEAVTAAEAALGAVDRAFVTGFSRLGGDDLGALASLQRVFAATPLGAPLGAALEAIARAEFLDHHFLVLATARAAIQGAAHDALLAQAAVALGRPPPELEELAEVAAQGLPPQVDLWLESTRHWLMELALAGFANLDVEILLPFQATLDALSGEPRLARHAALLGGLLGEFLAVFPTRKTPEIPPRRWVDLWTRAMVLAGAAPEAPRARPVTGELHLIAADLREHDTFATLVAYGILAEDGASGPRLVRASASAFKVDVIQGAELAPLFGQVAGTLLAGLAGGKPIALRGALLAATGDLHWDESKVSLGAGKVDPIAAAKAVLGGAEVPAARPTLAAADRHPALIDDLIFLEGYSLGKAGRPELIVDGVAVAVASERWPTSDDLEVTDLAGSAALVGLLRYDGGAWAVQPLAIAKGKAKPRMLGLAVAAGKGSKTSALATLQERASKLLRSTGR